MRETPEGALSCNPSKDWVDILSCCLGHTSNNQDSSPVPQWKTEGGSFPIRKVMSNIPRASFCSWGLDRQGHGEPDPFSPSNRAGGGRSPVASSGCAQLDLMGKGPAARCSPSCPVPRPCFWKSFYFIIETVSQNKIVDFGDLSVEKDSMFSCSLTTWRMSEAFS